jgi:preprotein translocase subunit SecD
MKRHFLTLVCIILVTAVAAAISLPPSLPINTTLFGRQIDLKLGTPVVDFTLFGRRFYRTFELKQGLDIQGGMQVVLTADMSQIAEEDRASALESARQVILRRVDMFGINEPVVQTSINGDQYRLLVELAGVSDPNQALQLLGTTAELSFQLYTPPTPEQLTASGGAQVTAASFVETGLTGAQLKKSAVQFDPTTGEPVISLLFDDEGTRLFADLTTEHVGKQLAIFIDQFPVTAPVIETPITTGQAMISGDFDLESAKQLAIQLNAGALPVPIKIEEQRTIGASLGLASVAASMKAGLVGISLVMLFMILYYRLQGVLASLALVVYAVLTVAAYKLIGITLTLPGIAGLLLSIGMAVDANILIFERMKEELRLGKPFDRAMELGFGRAWDSIKDANLATIATALVLINPLDFTFLNTSGLVRGFGLTLLIGVVISLFTGVVVTRTFLRLFLTAGTAGVNASHSKQRGAK